jgi:RES domain-containing protein
MVTFAGRHFAARMHPSASNWGVRAMRAHLRNASLALVLLLLLSGQASAKLALLLEEPFGAFGYVNPTGHAAIYLSDVCAASPTELRPCKPGEFGVVLSRYYHVAGYDWMAVPLLPYLYAVDSISEVPKTADRATEAALRDAWRREHLLDLLPDARDGEAPQGDWIQLVGSLYDRKIYAFEVETTAQQDETLIERFNDRRNRSHFDLFFHNCADFSRAVLDLYYPGSVRRSYTADLGMTTPKQLAKDLVHYADRHERMDLQIFVLPQVEGSIPRSSKVDGVAEAILRKKYVIPIAFLQPYCAAGLAVTYFTGGRFNPNKHAVPLDRDDLVQSLLDRPDAVPREGSRRSLSAAAQGAAAPMPAN